ncbi:hypothetical protein KVR01_009998 [Diaporthe batatas]|uniref:uncharacterized protein n=1 Tax=Diaporthe batatas TaxID=748121 RepID=UPI001D0505F3|nr:uncharacterized protein KVR01_009998 [Diaporthe batatas]KAG8160462.1 hypothetical protein KVR01_009998 [Diaporthe batatas]
MPPKAGKRKKEVDLHDEGSRGSPDDRPRKKTRTSTTQANQHFSGWVAWQNKFNEKEKTEKRQFADDFQQKLESKQTEIQNLIHTSNRDLNAARDKYSKLAWEANQDNDVSSKGKPQAQGRSSREENPLYKAGQHIFQNCRELVAAHEQANSHAPQNNTRLSLLREQWKEDITSVRELLLYGRQHGENLVDCLIVPSSAKEEKSRLLTPDTKGLSETGTMAVSMFRKSTGAINESGTTWGELAKSQVGAFGKVLDGLAGS